MSRVEPRLCVLTGVPGSGKTTVARILQPLLPPRWTVVRGDDFIGVTQACYPGKPWEEVRRLHAYFAGWSAGWYLAMSRGVILEGHFRDAEEIDRLRRGLKDMSPDCGNPLVVRLDGDTAVFAQRLAADPEREPAWTGPNREKNFLRWLTIAAVDPSIGGIAIDATSDPPDVLARKVADAFGIPVA